MQLVRDLTKMYETCDWLCGLLPLIPFRHLANRLASSFSQIVSCKRKKKRNLIRCCLLFFFFFFFFLSIQISSFPREQYDFCSFYFSCFWSHTFFTQLFVVLPLLSRADKELVLAERKHRPTNQRFQISPFFRPSSVDDVSLTDPDKEKCGKVNSVWKMAIDCAVAQLP